MSNSLIHSSLKVYLSLNQNTTTRIANVKQKRCWRLRIDICMRWTDLCQDMDSCWNCVRSQVWQKEEMMLPWHHLTFTGSKMNELTDRWRDRRAAGRSNGRTNRKTDRVTMLLLNIGCSSWDHCIIGGDVCLCVFGWHEIRVYLWQPVQRRRWRVWNWSHHRGPNGWNCWSRLALVLTADTWSHTQTLSYTLPLARVGEKHRKVPLTSHPFIALAPCPADRFYEIKL